MYCFDEALFFRYVYWDMFIGPCLLGQVYCAKFIGP
jgi:hypothetical protein